MAVSGLREALLSSPGTDVMIFKNISDEKLATNLAFLTQKYC
jgi:hypothetical protein